VWYFFIRFRNCSESVMFLLFILSFPPSSYCRSRLISN
jgi:hypothetical protein